MDAFKPALKRKWFIDRKIREKTYPTAASLARDYQNECGKYVNARTIAADIAVMREDLGAPIYYDAENRGYIYTDPSFIPDFLKNQPLDLKNLLAPGPQPDKTALIVYHEGILADGMGHKAPLSGKISVIQEGDTHGEVPAVKARVLEAIAGAKELAVSYRRTDYKNVTSGLSLLFRPCHLVYIEGECFVFGAVQSQPLLPYTLLNCAHIEDAKPTGAEFPQPDYVDAEAVQNGDIKIFVSENAVDTVLVFTRLTIENTDPEWTLRSKTDVFCERPRVSAQDSWKRTDD
jgi:hypothetical protein